MLSDLFGSEETTCICQKCPTRSADILEQAKVQSVPRELPGLGY